jgi:broad specificity phosphatase PhoE
MRLLLIRHGQSVGNAADRIQGLNDEPLTDLGREQAQALAYRLRAHYVLSALYSSPLLRALQTAEIIARVLGLSVQVEDRLKEYDPGVVTGMRWEEVQAQYPEIAKRWAEDSWRVPIPGEEGAEVFQERVMAALEEIVTAHDGDETVAVVAHGGTLSAYLAGLLELDFRKRQPWVFANASLSMVIPGSIRARLALLNDTSHVDHMEGRAPLWRSWAGESS